MNMIKKGKIGIVWGLLLAMFFLFSGFVSAHSLWINSTDYAPSFYEKFGGMSKIYFGWGHRYPVADFPDVKGFKEISLFNEELGKKEIAPGEGGFLATSLSFEKPGFYTVYAAKKPGFYTMHVDNGKIHHKLGPKTGLKGVILSNYYEQYAKCLISVGETNDDSFAKPIGQKLEIIPLDNPYKFNASNGQFLRVKVLFDGKPAKFCKLYATYSGFSSSDDFAYATTTSSDGIAKIRITHWGPWLLKAQMKLPPEGEMSTKCNTLSYTATLTFEIP
ncbi:DUF4198 domain-containing protein [Halocella sp. SP3-1]|uniref:DUF4198 domain-containing protein n=1 Tax=Halocella sp. SP3-1 TaxID=2382161 RepID=UPI000F75D25E|nr:DUF4198 domain-containing protein [Halocella sp. SP3-1]AZO95937.1 DUF4198 domain-containing protein [Halocella sp. SP3-1]